MADEVKNERAATDNPALEDSTIEKGLTEGKSMFDLIDEVEAEGTPSLASTAEEVEEEVAKQLGDDVEGTGLKADEENGGEEVSEEKAEPSEEEIAAKVKELTSKEESELTEEEKAFLEEHKPEPVEEPENEEPTDTTPKWLTDRVKKENPDLDITDEKAVQEAIDTAFASAKETETLRKDLEAEKEANSAFYNLLSGDENLRDVSRFMLKNNATLAEALTALEIEGAVDMEALKKENPDAYIEMVEKKRIAEAARKKEKEEREKRDKVFEENEKRSVEAVNEFKEELGMDSKDFDAFGDKIQPFLQGLSEGYTQKEFLLILHRGLNYEEAVKKANEEGRVRGRNESIEEVKNKGEGDSLPRIGTTTKKKPAEKVEKSIFDEALDPQPSKISDMYQGGRAR